MEFGEHERMKIQKKAWRSRCFFLDSGRTMRCCTLSFMGVAIEHLIARTDYLDERQKGLLDLPFAALNPFTRCRQWLCRVVVRGKQSGSHLHPLFHHFRTSFSSSTIMLQIVGQAVDMGSQIWWRFLPLHELPFSLVDAVNDGLSADRQVSRFRSAFQSSPCCRDRECTEKLVSKYGGSWQAAMRDKALQNGLRTLAWTFNFGNMRSERLLALTRRSLDGNMKSSEIEIISSKEGLGRVY